MEVVVDVEEVAFKYRDVEALRGVSFQVQRGEIFGLLGPNGAGKTTLIEILSSQRRPLRGRTSILGLDCEKDARPLRRQVGLATHDLRLNPYLTVEETLTFYGILYGLPRSAVRERVSDLVEEIGLAAMAKRLVAAQSEGMKGRLNLALALVHDPPVLILDEPTHALDPRAKHQLWVILDRLRRKGKTILLTTHDMDEAEFLSDQVAILDRGKVIAAGTVDTLKSGLGTTKVVEIRMECQPESIEEYRTLLQEQNVDCLRGLTIFTGNPQAAVQRLLEHGGRVDQARIMVRNPSLEDVFIKLTGRSFDPDSEEAGPGQALIGTTA